MIRRIVMLGPYDVFKVGDRTPGHFAVRYSLNPCESKAVAPYQSILLWESLFGLRRADSTTHHHRHRFVVVWLDLLARCIDSSPITTGMTIQSSVKIELRQRRMCGECESDVIYTLPATDRSPPMLTRAAVNFRHGVACRAASGTPRQALYRHCSYRLR